MENGQNGYAIAIDNKSVQGQFQKLLEGEVIAPAYQFGQGSDVAIAIWTNGQKDQDTLWIPSQGKDLKWGPNVGTPESWRQRTGNALSAGTITWQLPTASLCEREL